MLEPAAAVLRRDAIATAPYDAAKDVRAPRRVPADKLLLKSPAGLDGVEVRRVRRQEEHAHAVGGAAPRQPGVFVSRQVIEDQDVAATELGEQRPLHPGQ